jgi:hypothetical protein
MQIKRIEIGLAKIGGKIAFKEFSFGAHKTHCGCFMVDVWFLFITWLGDECYYPCGNPECECKDK